MVCDHDIETFVIEVDRRGVQLLNAAGKIVVVGIDVARLIVDPRRSRERPADPHLWREMQDAALSLEYCALAPQVGVDQPRPRSRETDRAGVGRPEFAAHDVQFSQNREVMAFREVAPNATPTHQTAMAPAEVVDLLEGDANPSREDSPQECSEHGPDTNAVGCGVLLVRSESDLYRRACSLPCLRDRGAPLLTA